MENKKLTIQDLTRIALFAALTGILAYINIPLPFSPVPVSGQTLGVMLAGLFLGSRKGALSQIIYLALGCLGLPIFAGGSSGIGSIFGPTGGFLWGFIVGSYVIGKITENKKDNSILIKTIALVIGGIIIIYSLGILQLILITKMSLTKAIIVGMLPFLPGDIFKIILTLFISQKNIFQRRY